MSNNKTYKPGEEADRDLKLAVKDANGQTLSEIEVKKGNRIPPTRVEGATGYVAMN